MKICFVVLLLIGNFQTISKKQCHEMIQTAIEARNKKEFSKSLELLIDVEKQAKEKKWYLELFLAQNNIGANYYQLSDYSEALQNYLDAYNVALEHLNPQQEMVVLNNVGILFYDENQLLAAEEHFSKAFGIASQFEDHYKMGLYATNLALVYNKSGELLKADDYINKAISILKNESEILLNAKYVGAENLFLRQKYDKAKQFLLALIPQLDGGVYLEQRASSYLLLSKIFQLERDYQSAHYYAGLAKQDENSIETQIEINEQFSALYFDDHKYVLARTYRDSVLMLKDSLYHTKSNNRFESSRVKFAIRNYEKELLDKSEKFKADRKVLNIALASTVVLLIILVWAWRSSMIKNKQKKIISERNQKIKMMELENELEAKNRKLTVEALSMSSRNELLQEVVQSIKKESETANIPELRRYVNQLNKHIKKDSSMNDFLVHFEEANHGFLKTLKKKHPILNINDIRFICYLYMNLSIKEIATLLNITPDACRKRKERIGKKMGLKETGEIYNYLCKLQ